jgi:hypothetical protein
VLLEEIEEKIDVTFMKLHAGMELKKEISLNIDNFVIS